MTYNDNYLTDLQIANLNSQFSTMFSTGNTDYVNSNFSLLEKQNADQIIANTPTLGVIPPCHLNFGNLGQLDFSFLWNPHADTLNFALFNKLQRLSTMIRGINDTLIDIIQQLNCCQLAKLYNDTVLPIFKYILVDVIDNIISLAKMILEAYQVVQATICVIRPVPGNPWFNVGGIDYLKPFYNFLIGYDAVFKWIVNGNPIDVILNPVEDIYKKISSS